MLHFTEKHIPWSHLEISLLITSKLVSSAIIILLRKAGRSCGRKFSHLLKQNPFAALSGFGWRSAAKTSNLTQCCRLSKMWIKWSKDVTWVPMGRKPLPQFSTFRIWMWHRTIFYDPKRWWQSEVTIALTATFVAKAPCQTLGWKLLSILWLSSFHKNLKEDRRHHVKRATWPVMSGRFGFPREFLSEVVCIAILSLKRVR